jgi:hypothetical protein
LRDNAWHHLAVTRSLSTGVVQIFIDGVRFLNDGGPTGSLQYLSGGAANDPYIVIGGEKHFQGSPSYYGWIDEVRFSDAIVYSADFMPPTAPLSVEASTLALYHFDEGTGVAVGDANGNRSPGTRGRSSSPATPAWAVETPFSGAPSPGTVRLSSATVNVSESQSSVTLVLNRSGGTSGPATVDYATADGAATAGADYETVVGMQSWAHGVSGDRAITIPLFGDSTVESNETFTVALSNATGAQLASPSGATVTIVDDDAAPAPPPPAAAGAIAFTGTPYRVWENAGSVMLVLRRSGGSAGQVSVALSTSNRGARAPADYTAISQRIVTWADGDAADKTVAVTIVNDAVYEYTERFYATLSGATGGATLGSALRVSPTIYDDDNGQ